MEDRKSLNKFNVNCSFKDKNKICNQICDEDYCNKYTLGKQLIVNLISLSYHI